MVKYAGIESDLSLLFDRMHDGFWKDPVFQLNRNWRPTDISESEKEYVIEIELPRFKREEIKVEVTKGVLKVVAKNARTSYVREFILQFSDFEKTEVKLEDGLLKITVPKNDLGKTKYIDIK